ncbi:MmcQ/YjbR family DNA-binding protein [Chondromyces apiculatus]|uniref:DifB protein n=1 Tax=Chondromyces apiculatus DSM 436 TaxID=1192034 RepID=A0A017TG21_9BACT|nr:MmcQ/YjbR family DNA-binding protein [Chondromyces apiculatus]EYF08179.1 Hypothetical protein CAP_5939 [Chondromyces apiculatus DSM 436]
MKNFASTDGLMKELRSLCSALPGAEEYTMVHHPAFRVGKKPFLIAGMMEHEHNTPTLSVNLGHMTQGDLLAEPRFTKTPYIGQHGWVTLRRKDAAAEEIAQLVEESWRRIASKKLRAEHDARSGGGAVAAKPGAGKSSTKQAATKKAAAGKSARKQAAAGKGATKTSVARKSR